LLWLAGLCKSGVVTGDTDIDRGKIDEAVRTGILRVDGISPKPNLE
jgi:hypothetical protein